MNVAMRDCLIRDRLSLRVPETVRRLRVAANLFVDELGVLADEDAPSSVPSAVKDD